MIMFLLNPEKITLKKLREQLGMKDNNEVRSWLKKSSIPHENNHRVFQWDVDFARQLEMVEGLMKRFPSTWHRIYEAGGTDKKMVQAVFAVYPPKVKVQRIKLNKGEKHFFK